MSSRRLDPTEARRILSIAQAEKADKERKEVKWPGSFNLKLLAEAVDKRRMYVEFEPNNEVFTIRYDTRWKAVFVRPADKHKFVPCGYFGYDTLKAELSR